MLYRNIAIEVALSTDKPSVDIEEASRSNSPEKFARGYTELTAACNRRHAGFIRIQMPTSSPFSDQSYENSKGRHGRSA